MKREDIIKLGTYITGAITNKSITPSDLFKTISTVIPGDSRSNYKLFLEIWKSNDRGGNRLEIDHPLNISPGFSNDITTDEQLSNFLPEEKILINKDIFRSHLENIDLINLDTQKQKRLIDTLNKESIGLSNNDVLLYYNLLKINQLSQNIENDREQIVDNRDFASELYTLAIKAFDLTPKNIKKANGGKVIDETVILDILRDAVNKRRINPQVLTICLGYKNSKFIDFFIGFITFLTNQRGDDVQDVLTYIGLYILLNGASSTQLAKLDLSSNVEAFITDRIGRVKSIYYVSMLFVHTYNVLLIAQIYEISVKFLNSPLDQRLKLEKLYSADTRRSLLVHNAFNIASRKISTYKSESIELQSAFKRYSGNKNEMVSVKDIFNNDYRN